MRLPVDLGAVAGKPPRRFASPEQTAGETPPKSTMCPPFRIALLAGCSTMDGLGQDIERGGEKIQEKAKR